MVQTPVNQRFKVLAEGLELLADNLATLGVDAATLNDSRRDRGGAVLRIFAEEEAAKVIILLDLARAGWHDNSVVKACTSRFYDHLARGLYVRAYDGSPADLAEVRRYIDFLRQKFYLDGPMDVDWIFANEVTTAREERLYVDYKEEEGGIFRWSGPAERSAMHDAPFSHPTPAANIVELVAAMHHIGLLTEDGLSLIRDTWDSVVIDDGMRWNEVEDLNRQVLAQLPFVQERELIGEDGEAVATVIRHWSFPLNSLDLVEDEVEVADLQAQRERWFAHEYDGEWQ
ncbi:AbiV family abortive infection protein [Arthrobacter sp. TMS2-4]